MTGKSGDSGGFWSKVFNPFDFSRTDFESFSHEQLLDMIESADPDALGSFGDKLTTAYGKINQIGTDLNTHIAYIDWDGASGAAFKEWGKNVAKATLALGDYSKSTGSALTAAADTLRTVKRDMPKVPSGAKATYDALKNDPMAHHDPDGQKELSQAHTQLETARIQAADQMHKLAQSYSFSTAIINSEKPPTYPPMPSTFVPPTDVRARDKHSFGYDNGSETYSSTGTQTTSSHSVQSAPYGGVSSVSTTSSPTQLSTVGLPVAEVTSTGVPPVTHIQSTGPLAPVAPNQTTPQVPITTTGNGPILPGPNINNPLSPVNNSNEQFMRGPSLQNPLREVGPVNTSGGPRNTTFNPRTLGRGPMEEVGGMPPARSGPTNGIYGGRPATEPQMYGGRPQSQVARGSVIGGRGSAARMPVGGMGGGGSMGGRNAMNRGAGGRLASEPGGVVGRTPAGEFAPGSTRSNRDRRRNEPNPEHLLEEDDWIPTRDDVVPPVID
jgi:uncharacterized protein YukE